MKDPQQPDGFRVLIVGGGIAGLTLANALQKAGIDYVLLEARSEIAPEVGASIGLAPNGMRVLDQLDCMDDIGRITDPLLVTSNHYASGELISPTSDVMLLGTARFGYPATFLHRQQVLQIVYDHIQQKCRIVLGKRISSIDEDMLGVTAHCTDGSTYTGSVIVGADGVFSKVRQEMWRHADVGEPGVISVKEKSAMTAEYICLFGISSATEGAPSHSLDYIYDKDISAMVISGKGNISYWFLFKKLDRVYQVDEIPKFTKRDAELFAEKQQHMPLMQNGTLKFGHLWKNRLTYTLVATEEAEYEHWTWGRIACLGDSAHKVTPNAGVGGMACIESAAALANALSKLVAEHPNTLPSYENVKDALISYQKNRTVRTTDVMSKANGLTRIHALKTWKDRIMALYVMPNLGDTMADFYTELMVGATKIDYLPPPERSISGTCPFNPNQGAGKKESLLKRAFWALPLVAAGVFASYTLDVSAVAPYLNSEMARGLVEGNGGSLPLLKSFCHVKFLDDTMRGIALAFAPSTLGFDSVSRLHMLTFLTDFGLLYSILLIESTRRANKLTLLSIPMFWGIFAQLRGIGFVSAPLFFLHYVCSRIENFNATDKRLTDLSYTLTVLPMMLLCYYLPMFGMYLHPSLATRQIIDCIWQMFPVWISLGQHLLAATVVPATMQQDRLHKPLRDLPVIRATIGTLVALSTAVWVWELGTAPYSMLEIIVPKETPLSLAARAPGLVLAMRNYLQWDEVLMVGNAALWMAYMFWDLKAAGMVTASWARLVLYAAVSTLALGPGAAIGLGWLWREQALAYTRHKDAVTTTWKMPKKTLEKAHAQMAVEEKTNGHAKWAGSDASMMTYFK